MRKRFWVSILVLFFGTGCRQQKTDPPALCNKDISRAINRMTTVMIHDITNPPLAARFFSYACLAGYEVVSQNNPHVKRLYGVLHGYPDLSRPASVTGEAYPLSAVLAMMETAKKMQPSGNWLEADEKKLLDSCRQIGYTEELIRNSQKYAGAVSQAIVAYAKTDGYNLISNLPRYTPHTGEGYWYPTPPGFMAAVEPYFATVRPFTLDSASQFKPIPPVAFSNNRQSGFYQLMLQNYRESLPAEHKQIAAFWDCNPFAVEADGHLMVGVKKISPGAHWLGIAGIASQKANKRFDETMEIYTMVSIGLMDAFICCWDEKYRSNRIRPETAIRKYIDPSWTPFLQTPPFPEYLSGHSVISAASATILTHYFGEGFSFTDSVEVTYGLAPRHFESFQQAATEAGLSRFYGGIHFKDAIDNGRLQGLKTGEWVLALVSGKKK